MDKCPCEKDVAVLKDKVNKHDKDLNGNGKDGLIQEMTEVKMRVKTIEESVSSLSTSYSALAKSQIENDAIKRDHNDVQKKRARAWGIVGIAIASGGTLLGGIKMVLNFLAS